MDTTRYIFLPVATYSMMTNTLNSTRAKPRSFSSTTTTKASAHMIMRGSSVGRLGRCTGPTFWVNTDSISRLAAR